MEEMRMTEPTLAETRRTRDPVDDVAATWPDTTQEV